MHRSQGDRFLNQTWAVPGVWGNAGYTWARDFNGDGKTDIASASGGNVYMLLSQGDQFLSQWYSSPDRPNGEVLSTVLQPDGKILIGGSFNLIGERPGIGIARLNADGSLDTGFNAVVNGSVHAIAVQPDGKVLVGGHFASVGGKPRVGIARLNPDGSLDSAFDRVTFDAPRKLSGIGLEFTSAETPEVTSLAVRPDGRFLVGSVDREVDLGIQRRGFILGGSIFLLDPDFDRRRQLAASSLPPPSKWKQTSLASPQKRRSNSLSFWSLSRPTPR